MTNYASSFAKKCHQNQIPYNYTIPEREATTSTCILWPADNNTFRMYFSYALGDPLGAGKLRCFSKYPTVTFASVVVSLLGHMAKHATRRRRGYWQRAIGRRGWNGGISHLSRRRARLDLPPLICGACLHWVTRPYGKNAVRQNLVPAWMSFAMVAQEDVNYNKVPVFYKQKGKKGCSGSQQARERLSLFNPPWHSCLIG